MNHQVKKYIKTVLILIMLVFTNLNIVSITFFIPRFENNKRKTDLQTTISFQDFFFNSLFYETYFGK